MLLEAKTRLLAAACYIFHVPLLQIYPAFTGTDFLATKKFA
jgi:hypothetical protein